MDLALRLILNILRQLDGRVSVIESDSEGRDCGRPTRELLRELDNLLENLPEK